MNKPLAVLIIEDWLEDAKLVLRELQRANFEITHHIVTTAAEMRAALGERTWDIILSDHSLPHFSGGEALELAKELAPDTPLIFVSGTIGEEIAVAAMKSGARDYVMKGDLTRLVPAINRELCEARNRREAKRAEETLRWRQALFEAQMDCNPDGILVVDSNGKKILQNERMSELWQIPREIADDPDDARQVQFVTARTKNPRQFAEKVAYLYTHTDEVSRDEIEMVDGRTFDRYSAPVRDKHGKYYGRVWMFRDISERKALEVQFRQAQKMDAIGQLAGGVAHDFNNILTATMMHLGMLRNNLHDEETRDALKELELQTQRAADLTKQLLMFSRKSAMEVKPVDLNTVVDDVLKMLRRLLGEQVTVDFRSTAWLPSVEADSSMMQQVLMNLALNARDAMSKGGQLTIATDVIELDEYSAHGNPDRRPGWFVMLSVSDTGCGMDDTILKRIFEPFFTTKELGKGTGLGLATVYGIVKQHQGWTEVESTVGKGSTFHVYLPVSTKAKVAETRETTNRLKGGSETILLVEDEAVVRNVTARWLQMLGYRVIEATNGAEAMELWSKHARQIQLLLTDMVMPCGISGLDLAEQFQKQMPALKVIVSSGYSAEINAQGIPQIPGVQFLQKPFQAQKLATAVRTCLDGELVPS